MQKRGNGAIVGLVVIFILGIASLFVLFNTPEEGAGALTGNVVAEANGAEDALVNICKHECGIECDEEKECLEKCERRCG